MIEFALGQRRQRRAVDFDQRAAQRLGTGAIGDGFETRDGHLALANGK